MAGPSISAASIAKYVIDLGYEVMADSYVPQSEVWREVTNNVIPVAGLHDAPYGHRGLTMVGVGEPTPYFDGQEVAKQTIGEGYAFQLNAQQYADELVIPDAVLEAANAQQRVQTLTQLFIQRYSANASVIKDRKIAGMLQKGTIAAGSATFFDNSYPAAPDANAGFIYDGKPWFAASGNNHPLKASATTLFNLIASNPLTTTNFDTAYTAMTATNAVDERNQPIAILPTKMIVGPAMRSTAMSFLESQNLPGSANNDINPNKGLVRLVVNRYLTDDSDAWWLASDTAGLIVCDSGAPILTTYRDESRKCTVLQAAFRFGATVTDWRHAFACNKATS